MSGLLKAGFFMLGLGVGMFGATVWYKHELEKPVGEIENYIPMEDRQDESDSEDISSSSNSGIASEEDISKEGRRRRRAARREGRSNSGEEADGKLKAGQTDILDYYKGNSANPERSSGSSRNDQKRKNFERQRDNYRADGTEIPQGTRYSRIYNDKIAGKALHEVNAQRDSRDSYELTRMNDDYDGYDGPLDDEMPEGPEPEIDIHDEFVLERLEDNIEIFLEDNPQDFVTLIFYDQDNTLCDENDEIVPNAEEVVGLAALDRLISGGPGAENGVMFVHNLKTSINYEVVLDAGAYQDTVMGQFDSRQSEEARRGVNT
jgi:hypothetical protein